MEHIILFCQWLDLSPGRETIELRQLAAAMVHGEDDLAGVMGVAGAHHAIGCEGELIRPSAIGRHPPDLGSTGDVGEKSDEPTVRRKRGKLGGADVQVAFQAELDACLAVGCHGELLPSRILQSSTASSSWMRVPGLRSRAAWAVSVAWR